MKKLSFFVIAFTLLTSVAFSDETQIDNMATLQGIYGIDMYELSLTNSVPYISNKTYVPIQYKQSEVHSLLGTPTYTAPGYSDLYVLGTGILMVYYDSYGDSAIVVTLPSQM